MSLPITNYSGQKFLASREPPPENKGLREKLIENMIFVARYWPNVLDWTTKDDIEYLLAYQMLPIPIDQRYGEKEMNYLFRKIQKL